MSHNKHRAEKTCLNCGTTHLTDLYCPHCGQENVEPKQSLWHLLVHFFNDFTHFDGKLFSTLKLLLFKPGYLSSEYILGRRKKYLDPVRMYLFVSTVFLIFLLKALGAPEQVSLKQHPDYKQFVDSVRIAHKEDKFNVWSEQFSHEKGEEPLSAFVYNLPDKMRHGTAYYDSVQKVHPDTIKYNWFEKYIMRRAVDSYELYDADPYNFIPKILDGFRHSVSKIVFISLPIFSIILFLFYIRRRNSYYFVTHAIFSLHFYVVMFLIISFSIGVSFLFEKWKHGDDVTSIVLFGGLFIYLYIAMLRFYKQGWFKTFLKATLVSAISFIFVIILAAILFVNSFLAVGVH